MLNAHLPLGRFSLLFFLFCSHVGFSQVSFGEKFNKTMLASLNNGDSLTYYQCRVVQADMGIKTSNQHIESKEQQISLTEKFVILNKNNAYFIKYSSSGLTVFPNRKFSGLKIREKSYWNFSFNAERQLTENELLFLAALEKKGIETTEYDFTISKYTTNQIIIRQRKNFEQLLLKNKLSISEALKL